MYYFIVFQDNRLKQAHAKGQQILVIKCPWSRFSSTAGGVLVQNAKFVFNLILTYYRNSLKMIKQILTDYQVDAVETMVHWSTKSR